MKKTKIITGVLFVGVAAGWILLAHEGPDSDDKNKRDKDRPEREVQRDKPRREEGRERPRREGDREQEERDRPRRENDREGDRDREKPHLDGDRERDEQAHGENELRQWAQQQERRIHELRKAGHNEEAERLLENLKRTMAKDRENTERGHDSVDERVRHMMAAIEHLRAVGMHDLAKQVEARAHGLHREREGHVPEGHEREAHEHHDEGIGVLRQEVEELKRAIRAIQNHLEKRDR